MSADQSLDRIEEMLVRVLRRELSALLAEDAHDSGPDEEDLTGWCLEVDRAVRQCHAARERTTSIFNAPPPRSKP
jgi:hypothetical protein